MPAVQPLEPSDLRSIGDYRLTGRLGEGGQAVVYLAENDSGTQVAVKFFRAVVDVDPAMRKGIVRELETAKQVARFCTAQVIDAGMVGNRPYLVSEYVPGPSLQSVVTDDGRVSGSALDRLAIGTATALVSLHDVGIIHCDFKPGNVLLGPDGWRVIDFGLSRMNTGVRTLTSTVTGTPSYMAPEQLAAEPITPATDVFSWASTVAFAATGMPPFGDDTIAAVMNRIVHYPPELTGVEEPLRSVLAECLAKDPGDRPTAQQLLDRLVRSGSGAEGRAGDAPAAGTPSAAASTTMPGGGASRAGESNRSSRSNPSLAPLASGGPSGPEVAGLPQPAVVRRFGRPLSVVAVAAVTMLAVWLLQSGPTASDRPAGTPANGSVHEGAAKRSVAGTSTGAKPTPVAPRGPAVAPAGNRSSGSHDPAAPRRHGTGATPPAARPTPSASPGTTPPAAPQRVELGRGNFGAYCRSLGWDRVRWRNKPQPGAYCVRTTGELMYLTAEQRDAGCQWRYGDPHARHYYVGHKNFCYTYA